MAAVAPTIVANATSEATRRDRPEVAAFVRELLMRQDPEGYARSCEALAAATDPGPVDPACRCCCSPAMSTRSARPTPARNWPPPTATPPSRSSPAAGTGPRWKPPAPPPTNSSSSSSPSSKSPSQAPALAPGARRHLNDEKERPRCLSRPTKILFRNVTILDSTGAEPYPGDVLVDNDRIAAVGSVDPSRAEGARVIEGRGRTLMSGLCDAHTHFTWNNSADLDGLGTMPVEEHLLFCHRVRPHLHRVRLHHVPGRGVGQGAARRRVPRRDQRRPHPRPPLPRQRPGDLGDRRRAGQGHHLVRRRPRGDAQDRPQARRGRGRPDQAVDDRRGDHRHPARRGHLLVRRGSRPPPSPRPTAAASGSAPTPAAPRA